MAVVTSIIKNSGKFEDILIVGHSPKGGDAKSQIAAFIRKYEKIEVDEVFFYYTGHGTRYKGDFLFLFSDFSNDKIEQTSLRNTELDSMLKSLSPGIAIKFVDACQAGTEYIKGTDDIEEILRKSSTASFGKIYFFFSSASSEASVALPDYSLFTKSFADAIVSYSGKTVRYRDLMAYISDDRALTSEQTPLFIQQANNTEIFCDVSEELAKAIKGPEPAQSEEEDRRAVTRPEIERELVLAIRSKSSEYCNEDEAQASLDVLVETVTHHVFSQVFQELYTVEVEKSSNYAGITGLKGIGRWLDEEKESYFARATTTQEEYEDKEKVEIEDYHSGLLSASYARILGYPRKYEYRTVTKYRSVIDGLQLTAKSPCASLIITFAPKEEILPWYKVFLIFVFSKSKLAIFYKNEKLKELSWDKRSTLNNQEWKKILCALKDTGSIRTECDSILLNIENNIISELSAVFGLKT